jgi:hypothetical protein
VSRLDLSGDKLRMGHISISARFAATAPLALFAKIALTSRLWAARGVDPMAKPPHHMGRSLESCRGWIVASPD